MASMLQNMTRLGVLPQTEKPHSQPKPVQEPTRPITAIYVSTSLNVLTPPGLSPDVQDYEKDGTIYRKLDPIYLAWLRARMQLAKAAHDAGQLPVRKWELLRGLFNSIQSWALDHFGEAALKDGAEKFRTSTYGGPKNSTTIPHKPEPWRFPKDGDFSNVQEVSQADVEKVRAKREEALSKGWSEASLFQNRGNLLFPVGHDWGLVCFLGEGKELGCISREFVEIVQRRKVGKSDVLRFQNPDLMRGKNYNQGEPL